MADRFLGEPTSLRVVSFRSIPPAAKEKTSIPLELWLRRWGEGKGKSGRGILEARMCSSISADYIRHYTVVLLLPQSVTPFIRTGNDRY